MVEPQGVTSPCPHRFDHHCFFSTAELALAGTECGQSAAIFVNLGVSETMSRSSSLEWCRSLEPIRKIRKTQAMCGRKHLSDAKKKRLTVNASYSIILLGKILTGQSNLAVMTVFNNTFAFSRRRKPIAKC